MPSVKSKRRPAQPSTSSIRHRFGSHLSVAGGIYKAIETALELRFDTVQVFVKNQRQWRAAPLRQNDLDRWFELRASPGFGPPIAHATYLINLASPDDALWEKSRRAFAEELWRCDVLDIPYLVVHPGAALDGGEEEAIARVAAALNRIIDELPSLRCMPLLEMTAGQGSCLGRTFGQLGGIVAAMAEPARVGVCIDTCHVFAAGYDFRTPAGYATMMDEAEWAVGIERIRCWHLNDSKRELGSRVDRHEHIGRGCIGDAGFASVLADGRFADVPMILETPKGLDAKGRNWDRINTARLRRIARTAAART
jgi:deoxyribonuclease-4